MASLRQNSRHEAWNYLRRILPLAVSAALIYYYFRNVDWHAIVAAGEHADIWLIIAGRALPVFAYWWLGAQLTQRMIGWFHKPVPLRDILWAKGALTLLLVINMVFSSGGFFIYLVRKAKIGPLKLFGIFLFQSSLLVFGCCVLFIPAALYISWHGLISSLPLSLPVLWLMLGLGLALFFFSWTYWRRGWRWGMLSMVMPRRSELWHTFENADTLQWIKTFGYILFPNLMSFAGYYLCALAFDVHIPPEEFILIIPLVIVVSALPIAFGGFGTTTAAWIYFFPQYADKETYLAMTLIIPAMTLLSRALVGIISLKPALREWDQITASQMEAEKA